MNPTPFYSVIIPVLNARAYLSDCLSSLSIAAVRAGHTMEVIVVDGGSQDGTADCARQAGAQVVTSPPGRGMQLRNGADRARGQILLFLHADTVVPEEALSAAASLFADSAVSVATYRMRFDRNHPLLAFYGFMTRFDSLWTSFGDQGILVRRDFYHAIGGFPSWPICEDIGFLQNVRRRTKVHSLASEVTTSSDKFARQGILRQQIKNAWLIIQYLTGTPPALLYTQYYCPRPRMFAAGSLVTKAVITLCLAVMMCGVFLFGAARGNAVSETYMHNEEILSYDYVDIDRDRPCGRARASIVRLDGEEHMYRLTEEGQGDYKTYVDVPWVMTATMREVDGWLNTQESSTVLKDAQGEDVAVFTKEYDYDRLKITYSAWEATTGKTERKVFPIKGLTCDNITMVHALKSYAARGQETPIQKFYLLTNEPKLYKVNMTFRTLEDVDLSQGALMTAKYQLMADLGPLTETAAKFVPPTYVWYAAEPPYHWVRYQGLESGLRSPTIQVTLTERSSKGF